MHINQQRLIELAKARDISAMGLREIGRQCGIDHPQTVKYHLEQLVDRGLLVRDGADAYTIPSVNSSLVSIPILGRANCGEALLMANEQPEGIIKLSKSLLATKRFKDLFAIKAVGTSMNKANIHGATIDDGDIVVVDSTQTNPSDGDYVLATIDGAATIKKVSKQDSYIALLPESSDDHGPIFVHPDDFDGFLVNGQVLQVYKS